MIETKLQTSLTYIIMMTNCSIQSTNSECADYEYKKPSK